ncbi:uncharacterized protein LOC143592535 isoform X2 [Bidens hawaiensis]|uniref:uncharacterized protein LOC143592535 isoform X2 n=1 Tax=Bidens hawaiensis TaxID=980011 RepID=UPI00404A2A16
MDPYNEQQLRDEVLYLHSLYHHGHPNLNPTPPPPINLKPLNPTRFKKPKSKPPKFTQKKPKPGTFSGKEWPVPPPQPDPVLNQSGWPELKLKPKPKPSPQVLVLSPQELVNRNWNHVQQRALDSVKSFYSDNVELSDEELTDENDEDEFDDDMLDDGENADEKVGGFFQKLFSGDGELKDYYVKYCGGGGGEFLCLVCGGVNEKFGKRFKDCVALVQHSVSVAKTKKVRSHRAYGKVVCGVLGWEIDRLPSSIVSDHKNNNDNNIKCNELQGNDVNSNVKSHDVAENVDSESMVCEDISTVANVDEEHNKNQVLNEVEGWTGGAVNNLCRNLSSTMVLQPEPEPVPV